MNTTTASPAPDTDTINKRAEEIFLKMTAAVGDEVELLPMTLALNSMMSNLLAQAIHANPGFLTAKKMIDAVAHNLTRDVPVKLAALRAEKNIETSSIILPTTH